MVNLLNMTTTITLHINLTAKIVVVLVQQHRE